MPNRLCRHFVSISDLGIKPLLVGALDGLFRLSPAAEGPTVPATRRSRVVAKGPETKVKRVRQHSRTPMAQHGKRAINAPSRC